MGTLKGSYAVKRLVITCLIPLLALACGSAGEIRSEPQRSFAYYYNLGMAAFDKKDYRSAIEHFKRSIQLNPNIPRTHNDLGMCYMYLREHKQAIPNFERALQLDPDFAEAHNNLGITYYSLGRLQEAELQFKATLASPEYSTKFIPLYNLGNIYQFQERYELAVQTYENAIQEEAMVSMEYRINIHYQLGKTLHKMERYREALEHFDTVLVLNPRMVEAAFDSGVAAYTIGDTEKARRMFSKVISIAPGSEWSRRAEEYLDILK